WVVLIGIDAYPNYPLRGCVSDAQLMQNYFTEDLHVPPNRIQLLLGSQEQISPEDPLYPSRTHITEMLLSLATNDEIQDGDNIIIFYAGHGACYTNEKDGVVEPGYVEAFCPIDHSSGAKSVPIQDISDRELNSILTQISRAKGHRITVILDCCHAGGVSR
ncbi:peptidase C14, caspase domain-containing protein, partial [Armillaria borealis]